MTDNEYRTLPRIANSDLTELLNLQMYGNVGKPIDPKAAQFGTTFHQLVLEPQKPVDWSKHHVTERVKLEQMQKTMQEYSKHFGMPLFEETEAVRLWDCPETSLPLKAKLDAIVTGPTGKKGIIDIKTTSCKNADEFMGLSLNNSDRHKAPIYQYGYDRQAAFYCDAMGIDYTFMFICVRKVKPFDVFSVNLNLNDERRNIIYDGRRKNQKLLQKALREFQTAGGWRPSSWSQIVIKP